MFLGVSQAKWSTHLDKYATTIPYIFFLLSEKNLVKQLGEGMVHLGSLFRTFNLSWLHYLQDYSEAEVMVEV